MKMKRQTISDSTSLTLGKSKQNTCYLFYHQYQYDGISSQIKIYIYSTLWHWVITRSWLKYNWPYPHLAHSIQSKVSLEPEKGKVSIARLKKVCCHQHSHMHVHWNKLQNRKKKLCFYIKYQYIPPKRRLLIRVCEGCKCILNSQRWHQICDR